MNQLNQTAIKTVMTLMMAGTSIAVAQDTGSVSNDSKVGSKIITDTVESSAGAGALLPDIIAGPFQLNDKAYYLLEPATWELSEQAAQEWLEAHLVTINTPAENEFIRNNVLNFDGNDRNGWLGLTDQDVEGNFVWMNNEPVGYTNWVPGEPNGGSSENYVGMVQGFSLWGDLQNNWGEVFTPVYGVVELDIPSIQAGPFYYNGHTYYLLDQSYRHQADAAARLLGGHLVTLDDADELSWVRSNVIEYDGVGRHAWLGLSDVHFDGIYAWDNDSMSTYRPWISGEPNGGISENYVIMFRNSNLWFDARHDWSNEVQGVVEIASPNPCTADLNNDGNLNFLDISEYLSEYGNGCP
jgi:Lectin C-type domain